jgi:hypothetical protein
VLQGIEAGVREAGRHTAELLVKDLPVHSLLLHTAGGLMVPQRHRKVKPASLQEDLIN